MFYKFDRDRSGTLEKPEVTAAIRSLGNNADSFCRQTSLTCSYNRLQHFWRGYERSLQSFCPQKEVHVD